GKDSGRLRFALLQQVCDPQVRFRQPRFEHRLPTGLTSVSTTGFGKSSRISASLRDRPAHLGDVVDGDDANWLFARSAIFSEQDCVQGFTTMKEAIELS